MLASFTVGTQYPRGDVDYNGRWTSPMSSP